MGGLVFLEVFDIQETSEIVWTGRRCNVPPSVFAEISGMGVNSKKDWG
jgi:hypothetical protein